MFNFIWFCIRKYFFSLQLDIMKKSDYELKYPTSDELWDSSIIVLDTNVILNLMRIPKEAREDFLKILEELKQSGKLWIPHQVAEEYYRHNEEIKK